MSAIVIGSGLGVSGSSAALLGQRGVFGSSAFGKDASQVSVNAATGNLIIQRRDELVIGTGNGINLARTYNSLGVVDGDNNDNWRFGLVQNVVLASGAVGAVGSIVKRTAADGAEFSYAWSATKLAYVANEGGAEEDRISFTGSGATLQWSWRDGASQTVQSYNFLGQLTQFLDTSGNLTNYSYNAAGLLTTVQNQNVVGTSTQNETITLVYDTTVGKTSNVLRIETRVDNGLGTASVLSTRVYYSYDASNRLQSVTTDLSPGDNVTSDNNTFVTLYSYDGASKRVASITQMSGAVYATDPGNALKFAGRLDFTYYAGEAGGAVGQLKSVNESTASGSQLTTLLTYGAKAMSGVSYKVVSAIGVAANTLVINTALTPSTWVAPTAPIVSARYIMVRKNANATAGYMAIAELRILDMNGNDLALNLPASSVTSATAINGYWLAANAVDGRSDNSAATSGYYQSASGANDGWIQVDLGSVQNIAQISISGATDSASYYNGQCTVYAANTSMVTAQGSGLDDATLKTMSSVKYATVTATGVAANNVILNTALTPSTWVAPSTPIVSARYVMIRKSANATGNTYLAVAELRILGMDGSDLVLNAQASVASSMAYNGNYATANAADGRSDNSSVVGGGFWHSASNSNDAWIQVDLGSVQNIAQISINGATDGSYVQNGQFTVYASNSAMTSTQHRAGRRRCCTHRGQGAAGRDHGVRIDGRIGQTWRIPARVRCHQDRRRAHGAVAAARHRGVDDGVHPHRHRAVHAQARDRHA